ncbi:MAG: hypothetical protein E7588_03450 [Ruminococcaceae bacterium]|nr:hypothetical protein [Oscillospiraceae bacterium]
MDIFKKPYFPSDKTVRFPYTREQLSQRPIFPTLVMDGGGHFFLKQTFGVSNGDEILQKTLDGSIFEFYKTDGVFDWKAILKRFRETDFLHEWEAHIWLCRMYILLPLAQKYMITGDKRYSDAWYKIFSHFKAENPHYRFDPNVHRFNTNMIWSDMQMVWRNINLIFSVYMMGEKDDCFTREQWCEIHDFIKLHAELIFDEAMYHVKEKDPGNHNLQIGLCMIMVGVLYPEWKNSSVCIETGKQVVKDNMTLSVYPDGLNHEDAISYFPFIARLYLESHLLLFKNGYDGIEGIEESLSKQYEFLFQFSQPDGTTPQFGDSYRFNVINDIEFVKQLFPLKISDKKASVLFPDGHMAVLRNEHFELFIDAMDIRTWHQHIGRMNFVLFHDGMPVVCDSGCTNYDRSDLRDYLNSAQAHNTLSLDSGEEPMEKIEALSFSGEGDVQHITLRSTTDRYTHTRTFTMYSDRFEIEDTAQLKGGATMTNNLHLHPYVLGYTTPEAKNQPITQGNTLYTHRIGNRLMRLSTTDSFTREMVPCVNEKSLHDYCVALRIPVKNEKTHKIVISFE